MHKNMQTITRKENHLNLTQIRSSEESPKPLQPEDKQANQYLNHYGAAHQSEERTDLPPAKMHSPMNHRRPTGFKNKYTESSPNITRPPINKYDQILDDQNSSEQQSKNHVKSKNTS